MHFSFASKSSFLHSHLTCPREAHSFSLSSAMADSSPYTKPHFTLSQANSPIRPKPDINKGKSYSGFLFKSLLFALFVVVLPLFPSQAPEFVNQTIITQFWELLHLLFIGIAVAYGLFSRRNVEPDLEIETQSIVDNTSCYVSTMFPVSSVFSDESENPSGYDENRMMMMHCNWNYSQYYESNALMVMDEQCKPQLPPEEDNFSDVRYDGTNVVQAWNSEYNHRQPMVVVAHPYYTIGECDEIVGYKPLGLPVRSLRSTVGDLDSPSNTNESDSSSGSRGSSRSSVKSRDRKFGDLGHYDSDQKFNDAAGSSSPDPWRSRSRKMKTEENHGKFSDATATVSSIPWQERSEGVEIGENYGEFNNVAGSASPIPWCSRSRKMKTEENHGMCSDATAAVYSIPWQERPEGVEIEENPGEFNNVAPWRSRSRRMKIEESHGKFSDAAASACSLTWQEESKGVEVEEKDGEADDVAGSASPIPWQAMSSWMESERNHEKFDDVGSSSIQWEESFRKMEHEENQRDFSESASPISWQIMSQAMESEENHGIFNDAHGSASPIQWYSRSKRMESEENHGSIAHPSHHRPLSAAETKSESFNSQAFQSTTSLSSNRSTYSSDSVPSDNMNLESEEMGQKKISDGSSSDIMNFQEEDSGGNMAYHGSSPRLKKMGTRENYAIVSHQSHYGSSSEKMNLQEEEPGANMASQRSPPRLRKMATREKYGTVARPSHFRPMSVDETQFESLGSQSFKSTGSCSSRTLLSSLDSVPSENLNLPKEDSGENKSSHGPSSSSPSPPARRRTEKASSQSLHFRGYSVGNLLQDGLKSSLKDEWIDLNGSEVQSHNKDAGLHLQSDTEKHESLAKAPTKGKSVRTRRTSGLTSETMRTGDMCSKQTDEKVEKMPNNVEPVLIRREKLRKGGPDHPSKVINKQGTDENVEKMPDNVEPLLIRREKLRKGGPDHPSKDVSKQSTDEKVEKMPDNNEPVLIRREKLRKGGSDHPSKGVRKQNNDCPCPKSEGTFSSYPKRDKEEPSKNGAKEDLLIEPENSKMSSDEDRMSECVNDSGLDSEVDKKASEFIAKFKAQIRLQKEASMDRSRGLKTMKRVLGDT
ncbi:hypothetical protein QN277_024578 [Acacia crassicarpa]|uniref:Uncharacterized protein n=1 Tax=Acacia crassicarpa TaxID=499986 RepID=A0AAE1MJP8_9FABA|nr:hypothetical protein QN277_024578 [Acacia crassicarpa]